MLTLYVRTGCSYCHRVYEVTDEFGIDFVEKNIADAAVAAELAARGGKRQVPYMVDPERSVEMYEPEDIARYLREHYAKT